MISRLMHGAGWYSYPSGHSMLAPLVFGLGVIAWTAPWTSPLLRRSALGVSAVLAIGVGISRVYVGAHYPTDVLGGLLLGTAWSALWLLELKRSLNRSSRVASNQAVQWPTDFSSAGMPIAGPGDIRGAGNPPRTSATDRSTRRPPPQAPAHDAAAWPPKRSRPPDWRPPPCDVGRRAVHRLEQPGAVADARPRAAGRASRSAPPPRRSGCRRRGFR